VPSASLLQTQRLSFVSKHKTTTGYSLNGRGVWARFLVDATDSRVRSVQTNFGFIQMPIEWVAGDLSLGLKRQELQAGHYPSSTAEFKKDRAMFPVSHTSSWCVLN
jgi:hypothetical protein